MEKTRIYEAECECSAEYDIVDLMNNVRIIPGTERTCKPCRANGVSYRLGELVRNFNESPDGSDA